MPGTQDDKTNPSGFPYDYSKILRTQELRATQWEAILHPDQVQGVDIQKAIALYAPEPFNAVGVHNLTDHLYDAFSLVYLAPHLDPDQWKNPTTRRYLPYLLLEVPCLVRALSVECEARGIPSSPLGRVAIQWARAFRQEPDPKSALLLLAEQLQAHELINELFESAQRLLRATEKEARQIANNDQQPVAGSESIPQTSSVEGREVRLPLRGWQNICRAINAPFDTPTTRRLRLTNAQTEGPIKFFRRRPEVDPEELRTWIRMLQEQQDRVEDVRTSKRAAAAELSERKGARQADHAMHAERRPNARGKAR